MEVEKDRGDNLRFQSLLKVHKQLSIIIGKERNKELIARYKRIGDQLTLFFYDFKCARCRSEENIQIHHFIERPSKHFMDFWSYLTQRYYWANTTILCGACHKLYHNNNANLLRIEYMKAEKISKIKKIFGLRNERSKSEGKETSSPID